MNKTIEKFKNLLNKEAKRISAQIINEAKDYNKSKIFGAIQNMTLKTVSGNMDPKTHDCNKIEQEFRNLKNTEIATVTEIDCLLNYFGKKLYFNDFPLLQKYLDKYGFTSFEQALVLAFYLNSSKIYFEDFTYEEYEEEIRIRLLDLLDKNSPILKDEEAKNFYLKRRTKDVIRSHKYHKRIMRKLKVLLSPEGDLMPCLNALDFKDLLILLNLNMTEEQIMLLLNTSQNKAIEIRRAEEFQTRQEFERALESKKRADSYAANLEIEKALRKEAREAIQKLKNYLSDNKPIRYLEKSEIIEITNLLIQARFSDEQIMQIQKAILINNASIEANEQANKLQKAITKYLSVEQIEIIKMAESIILDNEAIKNPIYEKISSDYALVTEQLISLVDVDVNDSSYNEDAEILLIAIEELRDAIINYSYSDYRYSLAREKKDN